MTMLRAALLSALLAMLTATPIAGAADFRPKAEAALSQCLASFVKPFPPDAPRVVAPPGLARGTEVEVVLIAGTDGRYFAYRGIGNELACGVAIYGSVSTETIQGLKGLLERDKRWARHAMGPYGLSSARPARQTYWADPLAPGLSGALMLERDPGVDAPTLEIDVHTILVS